MRRKDLVSLMRILRIMLIVLVVCVVSALSIGCGLESDSTVVAEEQLVAVQRGDLAIDITAVGRYHWVSPVAERNVSISSAGGMEVCAPLTVAESAAAADALRRDSFTEMSNDSEQAKTPQKQSPVPTVSTTLTVNASW